MNSLLTDVSEQTIQERFQKDFGLLSHHADKKPFINPRTQTLSLSQTSVGWKSPMVCVLGLIKQCIKKKKSHILQKKN